MKTILSILAVFLSVFVFSQKKDFNISELKNNKILKEYIKHDIYNKEELINIAKCIKSEYHINYNKMPFFSNNSIWWFQHDKIKTVMDYPVEDFLNGKLQKKDREADMEIRQTNKEFWKSMKEECFIKIYQYHK